MTEPDNIILEHLRAIRGDIASIKVRLDRIEKRLQLVD